MSDPNQPYGAVPPPPFPPPGAPAGPPNPPFPPPPGAGGSGKSGKGLWIALAVIGVLALVGLIVGLILLLTGDDDDKSDDKGDDKTSSTVSGAEPDEVVESLIDAAEEGDCDAASEFLTEAARAGDPCESSEFQLLSSDDVDAEVGDAVISGETATVPVTFTSAAGTSDYVFELEQVDGTWLVSSYDEGGDHSGATSDSTDPTDPVTPTDPTDPSTTSGGGGGGGGTSTADAVPNEPKAVVEAFLESAVNGDCATAEDLVTPEYLKDEGDCDPNDIPSDLGDQFTYTVGTASVNDAAGTATVPVSFDFAGSKESGTVKLVKVGGQWLVNEFE